MFLILFFLVYFPQTRNQKVQQKILVTNFSFFFGVKEKFLFSLKKKKQRSKSPSKHKNHVSNGTKQQQTNNWNVFTGLFRIYNQSLERAANKRQHFFKKAKES